MAKLFQDIRAMYEPKEIEKFNPYHDSKGRFSTGPNATSFTIRTRDPKKQHWADMARDRESVRTGKLGSGVRMVGTKVQREKAGHNVYKPKSAGGKLIGNAERQRAKLKRMDANGEKYESSRERKNRLARERRANAKKTQAQQKKSNKSQKSSGKSKVTTFRGNRRQRKTA